MPTNPSPITRVYNLVKLERKEISAIYFYAILNGLTILENAQNIVVEVGKTYAFVNGRKKKGLVKITGLEEGVGGKITFDIKVQK